MSYCFWISKRWIHKMCTAELWHTVNKTPWKPSGVPKISVPYCKQLIEAQQYEKLKEIVIVK